MTDQKLQGGKLVPVFQTRIPKSAYLAHFLSSFLPRGAVKSRCRRAGDKRKAAGRKTRFSEAQERRWEPPRGRLPRLSEAPSLVGLGLVLQQPRSASRVWGGGSKRPRLVRLDPLLPSPSLPLPRSFTGEVVNVEWRRRRERQPRRYLHWARPTARKKSRRNVGGRE